MSSKRNLVMMALVALMASLAAAQTTPAKKADTTDEKAPRLTIVEPGHEYGEVAKRDKLDWSYLRKPGQNQYRVDITVGGPDAKIGAMADKIKIVTNSKHSPEYPISITGVIRPTYRVEPTALNFGEVAPSDAAATRSVLLHSNDLKTPEQFTVTKVESDNPSITTAFKPLAQKGDFEVTLQ